MGQVIDEKMPKVLSAEFYKEVLGPLYQKALELVESSTFLIVVQVQVQTTLICK